MKPGHLYLKDRQPILTSSLKGLSVLKGFAPLIYRIVNSKGFSNVSTNCVDLIPSLQELGIYNEDSNNCVVVANDYMEGLTFFDLPEGVNVVLRVEKEDYVYSASSAPVDWYETRHSQHLFYTTFSY